MLENAFEKLTGFLIWRLTLCCDLTTIITASYTLLTGLYGTHALLAVIIAIIKYTGIYYCYCFMLC